MERFNGIEKDVVVGFDREGNSDNNDGSFTYVPLLELQNDIFATQYFTMVYTLYTCLMFISVSLQIVVSI